VPCGISFFIKRNVSKLDGCVRMALTGTDDYAWHDNTIVLNLRNQSSLQTGGHVILGLAIYIAFTVRCNNPTSGSNRSHPRSEAPDKGPRTAPGKKDGERSGHVPYVPPNRRQSTDARKPT
jgi:hypothetical protein